MTSSTNRTVRSRRRRRSRADRFRRRLRRALPGLLLVAVVVLGYAAFLGWRAVDAKRDLTAARSLLRSVERSARAGDVGAARVDLARAQQRTADARSATDDLAWRIAARLPWLGDTVGAASGVAREADVIAREVLAPLVDVAATIEPRKQVRGTTVELGSFAAARRPLASAVGALQGSRARIGALPRADVAAVRDAQAELGRQAGRLSTLATGALAGADIAPAMLGGQGTRTYFLAVQNNAESRGTGGLLGAYGVLTATNGRVQLTRTGPNGELPPPGREVVDLGLEFRLRYGRLSATSDWRSANATPDFPSAGRIWTEMWNATHPSRVDGVVAVDPIALAYLLEATGPVRIPDGTVLSAGNAASYLLATSYARYSAPGDNARREAVLGDAMRAVFDRVARGDVDGRRVAERLGRAALTGHLRVYSARPTEQAVLTTTAIAGGLPAAPARPYLQVVTQNSGGNKLDYYLRRTVRYDGGPTGVARDVGLGAPRSEERGVVTVTLTNTAPRSGLPEYVTLRPDLPPGTAYPRGQSRVFVSIYGGVGATHGAATLNGRRVALQAEREKGHGVFSTAVTLDPGRSATLVVELFQPASPGLALRYDQQPLVRPDDVVIRRT